MLTQKSYDDLHVKAWEVLQKKICEQYTSEAIEKIRKETFFSCKSFSRSESLALILFVRFIATSFVKGNAGSGPKLCLVNILLMSESRSCLIDM